MVTFLFILIVTSGIQILGYALVDVFLLTGFIFLLAMQNKSLKIKINWVFIFCIFMLIQVLRGMYVLADLRMIYWIVFFITLYFSHQYIVNSYKKSKIDLDFAKKVFNFSLAYFVIYGLLPIFIEDPDNFQGIYWVGSSAAFIIIIPLLASHYVIFERSGYSLANLKIPSLLIYLIVTVLHYSRTGMYLLFLYMLFLFIKTTAFSFKKIIFVIPVILISFLVLDTTRQIYYTNSESTGATEIAQVTGVLNEGMEAEEIAGDINRFLMVISVYEKFTSSPVEFLLGSGWYTSRYALKPFEASTFKSFGLNAEHLSNDKPMQITSFAAILSDTGLIGMLFIIYFFLKSTTQIIYTKSKGVLIFLGLLYINWLFYLVGNSFVSIISFLLIFPDGIIVNLARLNQRGQKP
jgi:hypothetical protein